MFANTGKALVPAVLATALLVSGCGPQFGALLYHSHLIPEPKTKTQFKLSKNKIAILVDDPTGSLPHSDLRDDIVRSIASELTDNKAATAIATPNELARVERSSRDFDNMSIRAVGEELHAQQVLYVQIQTFTLGDQTKMGVFKGKAKALIKVCSTERKPDVRLWPAGGDGQVVEVAQPSEQTDKWNADTTRASDIYAKAVCQRLGKRIAMLFYQHVTEAERDLAAGRQEEPR